jgi:hypothetical protein
VDEISSSVLSLPFIRASQKPPCSSWTEYQLPVDLKTNPSIIIVKFTNKGANTKYYLGRLAGNPILSVLSFMDNF